MLKSQKHVFWEALLVTVFIFGIGVLMGVILENWRTAKISDLYQESEVELLDVKLQTELYSGGEFDCNGAIEETLNFADEIYEEAKILDRYEGARRLTDNLIIQHKKYDILRAMLFLNSVKIKETCNASYHNVVYFYTPGYQESRLDLRAKQQVFSRLLGELKEKEGSNILLIPIAVNEDVFSIKIILDKYGISKNELPVILIDENVKVTDVETVEEIQQYLD